MTPKLTEKMLSIFDNFYCDIITIDGRYGSSTSSKYILVTYIEASSIRAVETNVVENLSLKNIVQILAKKIAVRHKRVKITADTYFDQETKEIMNLPVIWEIIRQRPHQVERILKQLRDHIKKGEDIATATRKVNVWLQY